MIKRSAIIGGLIFILVLISFLTWMEYSSRYTYFNKDKSKCITVWKTLGGNCYIIPYKYKSIFRPTKDYIITNSNNIVTAIWGDNDLVLISSGYNMTLNLSSYHVKWYDAHDPKDYAIITEKYYKEYKGGVLIDTMDYIVIDILNSSVSN